MQQRHCILTDLQVLEISGEHTQVLLSTVKTKKKISLFTTVENQHFRAKNQPIH